MKRIAGISTWLIFLSASVVLIAVLLLTFHNVRIPLCEVDEEFVFWRNGDITNKIGIADSEVGDYSGPSADFLFEERLRKYEPSRMLASVMKCLRRYYPDCNDEEKDVESMLKTARYYNRGKVFPRVHMVVCSSDPELASRVAYSYVYAVAIDIEKNISERKSTALSQAEKRLARYEQYCSALEHDRERIDENAVSEVKKLREEIKLLKADVLKMKECARDNEWRIYHIRQVRQEKRSENI